jgi:hypothetical protein
VWNNLHVSTVEGGSPSGIAMLVTSSSEISFETKLNVHRLLYSITEAYTCLSLVSLHSLHAVYKYCYNNSLCKTATKKVREDVDCQCDVGVDHMLIFTTSTRPFQNMLVLSPVNNLLVFLYVIIMCVISVLSVMAFK